VAEKSYMDVKEMYCDRVRESKSVAGAIAMLYQTLLRLL
jgi:hypothetical protein